MNVWGAVAGGFAGTIVLTTLLRAASELAPAFIAQSGDRAGAWWGTRSM